MNNVEKDSNYKGTVENLNIVKADAIAVPYGESFYLADSAETTTPTVYIKTTDGRYYTDEFSNTLVEVVEK